MHKIDLSKTVTERATARRGTLHPISELDPARTALVVVDMQNAFVDPELTGSVPGAADICPNITRLAAAVRAAGGTVAWLKNRADEDDAENWPVLFETFVTPELRRNMIATLSPGTPGFEIFRDLSPEAEDLIVEKTRFSAFIQGSSDLEALLRDRGIDTLLITGTVTNVCCESTARDAAMLNFKVVMIADGNAARSDEEHNATLSNLINIFADVRMTDEVVEMLQAAGASQEAAE